MKLLNCYLCNIKNLRNYKIFRFISDRLIREGSCVALPIFQCETTIDVKNILKEVRKLKSGAITRKGCKRSILKEKSRFQ
jgi:hypothetical protein